MAFRTLYEPPTFNDEVPWLKEYLDQSQQSDIPMHDPRVLVSIIPSPKGWLMLTDDFKAFAFNGSGIAQCLVDFTTPKAVFGMLFIYSINKRPALAIDDDLGDCIMVHHKGGPYIPTLITSLDPAHPARVEFETGKAKAKPRK